MPLSIINTVIRGLAAGLVQAAVIPILPPPLAQLEVLALPILSDLVRFRFREALIVAAVGGLTGDILTPSFFGLRTAAALVATGVLFFLFVRVFTHAALPSLIGLSAAGFLIFRLLRALETQLTIALSGFAAPPMWSRAGQIILAALIQSALTLAVIIAARRSGRGGNPRS